MEMIRVSGLTKSYGDVAAVRGIDFTVAPGELFGLIGPDGAGKTTTMRILVTLLRPGDGDILINGHEVEREVQRIRSIVGYMPQRFSLYQDLSVNQNLHFFAELFGVPKGEIPARITRLYRFNRLEEYADRQAGRLSGGMKQKLALSCTLIHDPLLLVLDEPTTGVDPVSRGEFWTILDELRRSGVTILVSTPYMDEALRCDRVAIMHEGVFLAQGPPREMGSLYTDRLYLMHAGTVVTEIDALRALPGIISVQGFGDTLHIGVAREVEPDTAGKRLGEVLGREVKLQPVDPSLEDVFIRLIEREKGGARA